jgi:AraC family transcriptional activator of pobA
VKLIPIRQIAFGKKEKNNADRFNIREVQTVVDGKDLVHHLHKHDFFFVLALQKGQGIHEIDFIKHHLQDNTIFILRPGQVHQLELKADCTGYLLEFDTAFYQPKNSITDQGWRTTMNKNYCEVEVSRFKKLLSTLSNIFNEYTDKEDGYVQAITANLDLFFLEYVRQSRNLNNTSKNTNNYSQERFEDLVDLLETNIGSLKNVSQYADLLNLSPYQLNAITKASVGKTVSELINEQIILEAKRYLLATPNQIKDVADHLGYEDVSYFIRFFKKHTGHSPEGFRRNFK